MNEADRIKLELKRKRNKDLMFYIILIIFVALAFCIGIVSFANRYKPDPSLYVEYDLSKDYIPEPIQEIISEEKREKEIWNIRGVQMEVTKIATYDITGKVEAIKDFGTNMIANILSFTGPNIYDYISPRDLTISWGDIAKEENSSHIYCDQYEMNTYRAVMIKPDRYLYNKYGLNKIMSQVSNNHIITINRDLRKILSKIKLYDLVRIKGYLVEVNDERGGKWGPSSLERDDIDLHSCEIILAEDIVILNKK